MAQEIDFDLFVRALYLQALNPADFPTLAYRDTTSSRLRYRLALSANLIGALREC